MDQDLFGGQYNFGQADNPFGAPPVAEKPKRRFRTCLIITGVLFACVAISCLCLVFAASQFKEQIPPTFWIALAGQGNLDQIESYNLVCPGSQAETFTRQFVQRYPNNVSISVTGTSTTSDTVVRLTGTLEYGGQSSPYEAIFTLGSDEKFFGFFDCIENIQQVSP